MTPDEWAEYVEAWKRKLERYQTLAEVVDGGTMQLTRAELAQVASEMRAALEREVQLRAHNDALRGELGRLRRKLATIHRRAESLADYAEEMGQ